MDKLEQRSTEHVKEALELGVKQFPSDRLKVTKKEKVHILIFAFSCFCFLLKKFPELKFKYVEEEQPEDFFVPYVWTLGAYPNMILECFLLLY